MKKFLSLVLALVMTMSLVTISAGAKDFTDDKSITYGEAVDVVSAIGVVDGYTDGSFNPSATLTRGAAAKIICNLLLGPTTASALVADAAPFSDVPTSNVFAGYIAYCAQQGIISGYADGTFRPAGTLTSYAFMKMLLGALGYDAQIEGFVGGNWSVQVAKTALGIGLDDGLKDDFNGVKPVTREEAALYAFNTLTANMVDYGTTTSMNVNGADITISGNRQWDRDVTSTDGNIDGEGGDKIVQFAERYFGKLTLDTDFDTFMRPANVWTYKGDSVGTYAKTPEATYTKKVSMADIYADCSLTSTSDDFVVYIDGIDATSYKAADRTTFYGADNKVTVTKGDEDTKVGLGNGAVVEVFKDEGIITIINTYVAEVITVEEATSKREAYIELGPVGSSSLAENAYETPEGEAVLDVVKFTTDKFEVGDIVTFNYSFKDTVDTIKNVAATESVTGTVKSFTTDKKFDLDGTSYEYGARKSTTFGSASIGTEATVYMDANGYVLFTKEGKDNVKNYALVLNAQQKDSIAGDKHQAYLLFTDGTTKIVDTDKAYYGGNSLIGNWVTYKTNTKGETVLTKPGEDENHIVDWTSTSEVKTENGKAGITLGADTTKKVNSATIVIVKDKNDKYTVYEGIKNMPSLIDADDSTTTVDVYSAYGTGTFLKFLFVDANNSTRIDNGTNKTIFLVRDTDATVVETASDKYYVFDAVVDGKIVEDGVMLDYTDDETKTVVATLVGGDDVLLTSYSVDANGFYTVNEDDVEDSASATTSVEKVSGTCIAFDDEAFYTADNCVFYRVDKAGNLLKSTISGFRSGDIGDYYKSVSYTVNRDGELTGVYWALNR